MLALAHSMVDIPDIHIPSRSLYIKTPQTHTRSPYTQQPNNFYQHESLLNSNVSKTISTMSDLTWHITTLLTKTLPPHHEHPNEAGFSLLLLPTIQFQDTAGLRNPTDEEFHLGEVQLCKVKHYVQHAACENDNNYPCAPVLSCSAENHTV